jgi:hypothetical protein
MKMLEEESVSTFAELVPTTLPIAAAVQHREEADPVVVDPSRIVGSCTTHGVGDDAVLAGEVLYRSPLQHLDPLTSVYLTWVTRFSPTSCLPWGMTDPKVMHLDISTVSFVFNVHQFETSS